MKKLFLVCLLLFLCKTNVFAATDGYTIIQNDKVFDSMEEVLKDYFPKERKAVSNYSYVYNGKNHLAKYVYHVRSDHELTSKEILKNTHIYFGRYTEVGREVEMSEVMRHTGNPAEGDFMREYVNPQKTRVSDISYENGITTFTLDTYCHYFYTKDEFFAFKDKIDEAITSFDLEGKDDYHKFVAVHNWMANHLTYSLDAPNPNSAIYLVLEGWGVCGAHAKLFYYMANAVGLDARVIRGYGDGVRHSWCIVRIDGKYYITETTSKSEIDISRRVAHGYLKGTDYATIYQYDTTPQDFFPTDYEISRACYGGENCQYSHAYYLKSEEPLTCQGGAYVVACANCGEEFDSGGDFSDLLELMRNNIKIATGSEDFISVYNSLYHHQNMATEVLETGCTDLQQIKHYCKDCGQYYIEYLPAPGHKYEREIVQEKVYCTDNEITRYQCKNCSDYYQNITQGATSHALDQGTIVKNPTVTEEGLKEYHCIRCPYVKTEVLPKIEIKEDEWLGDDSWENQYWKWYQRADGSHYAKLIRKYMYDKTITESVVADMSIKSERAATCSIKGCKIFIAKASFPGHAVFTDDYTAYYPLDENNHMWSNKASYQWSEDYSSCKAVRPCKYHADVTDEIPLSVSCDITEDDEKTTFTYTATGQTPEGKELSDVQVVTLDRVYTFSPDIFYEWDEDMHCKAIRLANENPNVKEVISLSVESNESEHSCEEEGILTYQASGAFSDGLQAFDEKTVKVEAGTHTFDEGVLIREPGCDEPGLILKTCQRCHAEKEEEIEAKGHDWIEGSIEETTCQKEGRKQYVCSRCKEEKWEELPKASHVWNENPTIDQPTSCKEEGIRSIHCKWCDEKRDVQSIPKTEHLMKDGKVLKEASCAEFGTMETVCSECGATSTRQLPKEKHIIENKNYKKPTCEEDGYSGDLSCYVCHEKISEGKVLKKTGHHWDEGKVTLAPTESATGIKTFTCSHCHQKKEEVLGKLPEKTVKTTVKAVEKVITKQKSDADIQDSSFSLLLARVTKVTRKSQKISWKKVRGATAYVVYGNQCGSRYRYKKLKTLKGASFVHRKLKKGTYYKYLVLAVKNDKVLSASKTIHSVTKGKYSNASGVRVNKKKVAMKKGKTFQIKAKEVVKKVKRHRKIAYESDNPKIVSVTVSGKVKAKQKGKCRIYVYAQNGVYNIVNVSVK